MLEIYSNYYLTPIYFIAALPLINAALFALSSLKCLAKYLMCALIFIVAALYLTSALPIAIYMYTKFKGGGQQLAEVLAFESSYFGAADFKNAGSKGANSKIVAVSPLIAYPYLDSYMSPYPSYSTIYLRGLYDVDAKALYLGELADLIQPFGAKDMKEVHSKNKITREATLLATLPKNSLVILSRDNMVGAPALRALQTTKGLRQVLKTSSISLPYFNLKSFAKWAVYQLKSSKLSVKERALLSDTNFFHKPIETYIFKIE